MTWVGKVVRWTRAHHQDVDDCWGIVRKSRKADSRTDDARHGCIIAYHGRIVHGQSKEHWKVGSLFQIFDPPEFSSAWRNNDARYEILEDDDVPDWLWADIARIALTEGSE